MYSDGTNRTRSQRQKALDKWGFTCTCPACENTPEGKEKEIKRDLVVKAFPSIEQAFKKALRIAQKMVAIQKSEVLVFRVLANS
jgi:hypothetical protein